jgi:hypothetical protein
MQNDAKTPAKSFQKQTREYVDPLQSNKVANSKPGQVVNSADKLNKLLREHLLVERAIGSTCQSGPAEKYSSCFSGFGEERPALNRHCLSNIQSGRNIRLLLLALAQPGLGGCAMRMGSKTIPRDRFDYSSAINRSWKEQMLLNL